MKAEGASHLQPIILTYHSISEGSSPLCTPPAVFSEQMEWLAGHAERVLSLAELVVLLKKKQAVPPKSVVLTFDDGFRDFYQTALPVLRRLRLPATVFVVTAYCGRTNQWPGQPVWCEEKPLMGWNEIRELAGAGIEVGFHTRTHPLLLDVDDQALSNEIVIGQTELEAQIGHRAESFCYPYGSWNDRVRNLVKQHFQAACGTTMGRVKLGSDLYCLPRIDTFYLKSLAVYRSLFSYHGSAYLLLRRGLRGLRSYLG